MSIETQIGFVDESTYGTAVTVTRFFPLLSENIKPVVERVHSDARRAGELAKRNDAVPNVLGYSGSIELPIYSKDFGWFLKHLQGLAPTTTGPTDSAYTHSSAIGTQLAKSFSCQVNRPLHDAGTNQAFSYEGGKITSWEISAAVGEQPTLSIECDFETCTTATALATASYTAGMELLNWAHSASLLTIGGSTVPITKFSVRSNANLKTDRHYIYGSALKKQPVAAGFREIEFDLECDFDSLTQYNRVISATASGAHASIVATLKANTLIGAASYPALVLTMGAARFDDVDLDNGLEPNMQTLSGTAYLDTGTAGTPLTVAYTCSQATP